MYELHVMGAVRVVRAALGGMIDRGGGNIVLFRRCRAGQRRGEAPIPRGGGAVISLTRALAKELGVYQIPRQLRQPGTYRHADERHVFRGRSAPRRRRDAARPRGNPRWGGRVRTVFVRKRRLVRHRAGAFPNGGL